MNQFFTAIHRTLSIGIFLINLGIIAMLLLSAFGVNIKPYSTSFFAYLGMTFPLWALLNIFFIIYWTLKLNYKVIFSVIALLLTFQSLWTYFPLNINTHKEFPEKSYKILTYNVQHIGFLKKNTLESPNPILEYISKQDADIVCMQEYALSNSKKLLDSTQVYEALNKYPYHCEMLSISNKRREGGLAIFSKYPIKNARKIEYNSKYNSSMICEIHLPDGVISVVNNHLESNQLTSEDRKKFSEFTDDITKSNAKTILKELMPKIGVAFKKRAHQADAVRAAIDTVQEREIIVCGDFNDTPGSYVYKKIKGELNDAFAHNGRGLGISYNQNRFYFRIDHLLYSEGLEFYQTHIEQVSYSDHYPIVGVFSFKN